MDVSDGVRHPNAERLRELIKEHGHHNEEVFEWAMLVARGKAHGPFLDMDAVKWAGQQSLYNEVPSFYLDRARRQLDPHDTPPDYVDSYRTLADLCPKAPHFALDKAARELADDATRRTARST